MHALASVLLRHPQSILRRVERGLLVGDRHITSSSGLVFIPNHVLEESQLHFSLIARIDSPRFAHLSPAQQH